MERRPTDNFAPGATIASHGRYVTMKVRRHPVADRPAASAIRAGMRGQQRQIRREIMREICLGGANRGASGVSVPTTASFESLLPAAKMFPVCLDRSKAQP